LGQKDPLQPPMASKALIDFWGDPFLTKPPSFELLCVYYVYDFLTIKLTYFRKIFIFITCFRLIDEGLAYDVSHPIHMHGNSFYVVAMERHAANTSHTGPSPLKGLHV
jgi:hypothetical protein